MSNKREYQIKISGTSCKQKLNKKKPASLFFYLSTLHSQPISQYWSALAYVFINLSPRSFHLSTPLSFYSCLYLSVLHIIPQTPSPLSFIIKSVFPQSFSPSFYSFSLRLSSPLSHVCYLRRHKVVENKEEQVTLPTVFPPRLCSGAVP